MDVAAELLGLGAALLVLGATAGLCVQCSRRGGKRPGKTLEQNSLPEDQQSFMVSRTYSVITQACPGPLMDSNPEAKSARKDKLLLFSPAAEGSRLGSDTTYIDPIPAHCYSWGRFPESPRGDDDAASYENVLICRQDPDSGEAAAGPPTAPCPGGPSSPPSPWGLPAPPSAAVCAGDEGSEDYQNSESIQRWRRSRGRVEPAPREDEDEDEEPDYVNRDAVSTEEA
ncbi:linker for activation of T-cells family member 2 isoform X2 [Sorex araneus]|uniref:linker for activation of T-cells family member 2 isoform X2 n=1 Tax=Sorex araneus TaxID=42254 RepID=UPI002433D9E1|nr:linker for activation of T-cells family member 2 isoform X2 [Sorex araneus]